MADPLTIGLAVGSTLLSAYGQMRAGQAAEIQGNAEQAQANYQAKQMEINAGQERASAQRRALNADRQKQLSQSKAIAITAASGGNTLDSSVVDILGDLEAEGTYNADVARYEGEDRARDLESGAGLKRYEGTMARTAGRNKKNAANFQAVTSLVSGASSMYGKYGDGLSGYDSGDTAFMSNFKGDG